MDTYTHLSTKAKYDYKLVRNALDNGDQRAYAELLERHQKAIYFLLLQMIHNEDDAQDLTLETFEKAFKWLNKYDTKFAFSTWLFRIATNNCIDWMRTSKRFRNVSIDKPLDVEGGGKYLFLDIRANALNPEQKTIKHQKILMMHEVVKKLPIRYRELVEMHYFKEKSLEEISAELNIPIGSIKHYLHKAREFLHTVLRNMEGRI